VQEHDRGVVAKPGPVLVVDDYADARANLREMLEELGQEVVEAGNGQEALDFLIFHPKIRVQLILLDLDMPHMTGWEFLALLKSYVRLANIPVLVVSRHTSYLRPRDYSLIDGYIEAPKEMPRLRALVEAMVSH
jgi:CheY-like chemotaxis protein